MSNQVTPEKLHYKLSKLLGEYEIINNYRPRSNRTGVWKIKSKQKFYFVKTFSRKSRWHPEVYAYQNWILALAPYAPELIEVFEEENWQGILISTLPGIIMREANLSIVQMEKAYFKAGELTRLLHSRFK
ncbi:MAG TPA: hypothetical protein GXX20_01065 [Clostridiaceae bacterium]|nr:hypothetical protein [Clostridiaceae bacterium]